MSFHRKKLGDIARIYVGLPTKASDCQRPGLGNMLTVRSLADTGIDRSQLESCDFQNRDVEKYRVAEGDLLLSARSTLLKTAIVPKDLHGTVINATVLGIRCLPQLEPRLLAAWFSQPDGESELAAVSQSGTAQMNITVSGLRDLLIPVPPVDIQRKMVALLTAADESYIVAIEAAEDRRRIARQVVVNELFATRKH